MKEKMKKKMERKRIVSTRLAPREASLHGPTLDVDKYHAIFFPKNVFISLFNGFDNKLNLFACCPKMLIYKVHVFMKM